MNEKSSNVCKYKLPNERVVGIEMLRRQTLEMFHTARLGYDGQIGDCAAALHQGGGGGP